MANTKFQGIVAVGKTQKQAINRYSMLAMGKGAKLYVDADRKNAFIAQASDSMLFNPNTGNLDLLLGSQSSLEKLKFEARAGSDIELNHFECKSGCGAHTVFDTDGFVQHCPVCTKSVSAMDEDLGEEDSEEESEEIEEGDEDVSEEVEVEFDESESEEEPSEEEESEEEESEESSEESEGEEETSETTEEPPMATQPVVVAAASMSEAISMYRDAYVKANKGVSLSSEAAADYMICSNPKCGAHVLSTDSISKCPIESCASDLVDPQFAQAGEGCTSESEGEEEMPETEIQETEVSEDEGTSESTDISNLVVAASTMDEAIEAYRSALPQSSLSSDNLEANHMVCSGCKSHILSASTVTVCPIESCASTLEEPASEEEEMEESEVEEVPGEEEVPEETMEYESDALEDEVPEEIELSDVSVSYSANIAGQPVWTAFYKGKPVAMVSKSDAGQNKEIFDEAKFGHAILAAAKSVAFKPLLKDLGFKPIVTKVNVATAAAKLAEQQIATAKSEMDKQMKQYADAFQAALSTAALGINRGFFANMQNPIREGLKQALSSAGVRNPEAIIDRQFKDAFEPFLKEMFAKANEIMQKPEEVRESLARTILDIAYQPMVQTSVSSDLEDSLVLGKPTQQSTQVTHESTSSQQDDFTARLQRVVGSLGR